MRLNIENTGHSVRPIIHPSIHPSIHLVLFSWNDKKQQQLFQILFGSFKKCEIHPFIQRT